MQRNTNISSEKKRTKMLGYVSVETCCEENSLQSLLGHTLGIWSKLAEFFVYEDHSICDPGSKYQ